MEIIQFECNLNRFVGKTHVIIYGSNMCLENRIKIIRFTLPDQKHIIIDHIRLNSRTIIT